MTLRTAIYIRTSFALRLTADEQACDLRQLAIAPGWQVVTVHHDNVAVGGKSAACRPGLTALLNGINNGSYDVVLVYGICLIGRNLLDLVAFLAVLKAAKVRLVCVSDGIDTANADGNGLLDIGVLFNAYVRFAKRERVLAGQHRARQAGVKFGRPSIPEKQIARVKTVLEKGAGVREAGRLTGVSTTSVCRIRDGLRGGLLLPYVEPGDNTWINDYRPPGTDERRHL